MLRLTGALSWCGPRSRFSLEILGGRHTGMCSVSPNPIPDLCFTTRAGSTSISIKQVTELLGSEVLYLSVVIPTGKTDPEDSPVSSACMTATDPQSCMASGNSNVTIGSQLTIRLCGHIITGSEELVTVTV